MSAVVFVMKRPRRRTHLMPEKGTHPLCGTRTRTDRASLVPVDMAGGATLRVINDLKRELDDNTCLRCTVLARVILLCFREQDTGRPLA